MSAAASIRPGADEYDAYYGRYVELVPDGDVLDTLERQFHATDDLLASWPEGRETFRYAPGKWSLRESVGHVVDTERMFGFRALSIGRGDPTRLPGMDQDVWAAGSNAHERPLADHLDDWRAVRHATLRLFGSFDDDAWSRRGIASERPVTVRALAWIIAGHERWHDRLHRERYLEGE